MRAIPNKPTHEGPNPDPKHFLKAVCFLFADNGAKVQVAERMVDIQANFTNDTRLWYIDTCLDGNSGYQKVDPYTSGGMFFPEFVNMPQARWTYFYSEDGK